MDAYPLKLRETHWVENSLIKHDSREFNRKSANSESIFNKYLMNHIYFEMAPRHNHGAAYNEFVFLTVAETPGSKPQAFL